MAYYLDLFSPTTYEDFNHSDKTSTGFRFRQRNTALRLQPSDKFICYITKLSRWIGVLEMQNGPVIENDSEYDPFVVRFRVKPLVWLPLEKAIPIRVDHVWNRLSFTRDFSHQGGSQWTAKLRKSLVLMDEADGSYLESLLREQMTSGTVYPIEPNLIAPNKHRVRRVDKDITVTVPSENDTEKEEHNPPDTRESIRIQALLAEIGSRMGMDIWIPRSDRARVMSEWQGEHPSPLERLPLNYDETTLKTVEQIDVLWLKGRAIKRAFEVEHTTSVYSGILRMADLLALQPNMDIQLHIVAPQARREKVFQELQRPVFSLLDRGPLSEICTYLSYDSVRELSNQPHLSYLSDGVVEEYEEIADE
ncbi:MAG: hypothetical protein HY804_08660 [Nitrospinae bacterium]|nr:hypothetical protein [Nitrospinota bacterium]